MSATISNAAGGVIVRRLIHTIHENRAYLSEIDGRIGDGDHGINMDKGFQLTASRLMDAASLAEGLQVLGRTLLLEIGGSMGPLYGQFFKAMARVIRETDQIDLAAFAGMIHAGYAEIRELGGAKPGDKTLVDTLHPAAESLRASLESGAEFAAALDAMVDAAEAGWKSTEDMVAKVGRSSRLGERSRGVLDAGATSCYLIVSTFAESAKELLS